MQTRVSTKGQIVLPGSLRRKLGIRAGDVLDASVEIESGTGTDTGSRRIVLTLPKKAVHIAKIVADPVTGFPVFDAGPDAPVLTSEEVAEILADFP
jgi:AbrB family looped-hinge helix DNA binding protein